MIKRLMLSILLAIFGGAMVSSSLLAMNKEKKIEEKQIEEKNKEKKTDEKKEPIYWSEGTKWLLAGLIGSLGVAAGDIALFAGQYILDKQPVGTFVDKIALLGLLSKCGFVVREDGTVGKLPLDQVTGFFKIVRYILDCPVFLETYVSNSWINVFRPHRYQQLVFDSQMMLLVASVGAAILCAAFLLARKFTYKKDEKSVVKTKKTKKKEIKENDDENKEKNEKNEKIENDDDKKNIEKLDDKKEQKIEEKKN